MQRIGLYYPYIHFRSEEWLKAAALYWPRMARVVPDRFVPADAGVALALKDGLDFVVDVSPREAIEAVIPLFREVFSVDSHTMWRRYANNLRERAVKQPGRVPMMRYDAYDGATRAWPQGGGDPGLGPDLVPMHWGEVAYWEMESMGLMVPGIADNVDVDGRQSRWAAMDPTLAWIWKRVVVDELARRTGYLPVTDQPVLHPYSGDWSAPRLAEVLLGESGPQLISRYRAHNSAAPVTPATVFGQRQFAAAIGHLVVRCVVPRGLQDIPVEKIIQLRTRHATEFDAFADAVAATAEELRVALGSADDPAAVEAYLRLLVQQRFTTPLKDLEAAMKGLRMEAGHAAIGYKLELGSAAAASLGGLAAGSSLLTAGAVAFGVTSIRRHVVDARDAHLRNSAVTCLLRIKYDLEPQSLLRRILRVSARAAGTGI
ncbi:DUF6236 family protein [Streptomyces sp. NBC_00335]|uniref:DUF6236 family protein n=1 Tax=unclassified Streptomyces TaxID=2593676 RepID=UPI002254F3D3|nr:MULTISPECIES: DUF6236 family protein [unclassified Streptomyces]MCX5404055.1 DUF6236 family protein [Streptomyces sp. NBC_00086]